MRRKKEIEIRNLIYGDFPTFEKVRELIHEATKDLGTVKLNYDWKDRIFSGNAIELPVDELLRMLLKHLNLEVKLKASSTELVEKKKKRAKPAIKKKK